MYSPSRSPRCLTAFTLVELLVVIAIVGVLIALLLPAVQSARETARRLSCKNNLKQIALGMHQFESTFGKLPPGYEYAADPQGNRRGYSWGAWLLPFMELKNIHAQIDFDQPVYAVANTKVRAKHLPIFLCPSDTISPIGFVEMQNESYAMACYVANFGTPDLDIDQEQAWGSLNALGPFESMWGPFYRNSTTPFKQITDGLSHTLMIGERQNGPFRSPSTGPHFEYETTWIGAVRDHDDPADDHGHMVLFQTGNPPNASTSDDRDVSAPHAGIAQFLFCDGSVHAVREEIDLEVYRALGTMNQGETVSKL